MENSPLKPSIFATGTLCDTTRNKEPSAGGKLEDGPLPIANGAHRGSLGAVILMEPPMSERQRPLHEVLMGSHADLDAVLQGASAAIAQVFRRPRVERRTVSQDGRSVTPLYDLNPSPQTV